MMAEEKIAEIEIADFGFQPGKTYGIAWLVNAVRLLLVMLLESIISRTNSGQERRKLSA